MTKETLQKAIALNEEIKKLSLSGIKDACKIIPIAIIFSMQHKNEEGVIKTSINEVYLSDEMK